ncbi:RDD family protein [Szabonella alba]|uniref:RDD family protein n=1 Tax=Szabonella alba TaxID=2804194 RepID=A0A8K0V9E3_9RHOB|nr:RDD family protein [Szabonella alba]MBL4917902.1 RDD family protein [Szabonella alba]
MMLPDPDHQPEFYAGVAAKRGMAWLVDTLLAALLTALIVPFTAFTGLFFLPLLYAVVSFFYRWLSIARGSATPGMRLTGIEFRRADGTTFDGMTALLHTAGYVISFSMVLPQILSVALMLFSARGQGLTDHVLGSVALNRPSRF